MATYILNVEGTEVPWRPNSFSPKGSGLELTAESCTSPYQEVEGFALKSGKACARGWRWMSKSDGKD